MKISPLPGTTDGRFECEIELGARHPHMDGHFAGFPVLPGVSQVDLVLHLISHALDKKVSLRTVQKTKFTALMRPGAQFRAVVEYDHGQARWTLSDESTLYSRGALSFEQ
jgi:3-hydroxymyristoyl/3-hydroxydecanoyl-(acyl carrier protein) dehydratase